MNILITGATRGIGKAIADEIANRKSEITRVEGLVSAEANRATGAEAALDNKIDNLQTSVKQVTDGLDSRLTQAEKDIDANTSNISKNAEAIAAETQARTAADTKHTTDIAKNAMRAYNGGTYKWQD